MRSIIARRILEETPEETREKVAMYGAKKIASEVKKILTMTDTLTDNEVIARFENLPPQYDDGTGFVHEDEDGLPWGYATEELEYHTSWSWLMPVWYKFKELKYPVPSSISSGQFYGLFLDYQGQIIRAIIHSGPSPSEACKLLAEGIRWYNSVKK
jgi:hypothetical protein